MTVNMKNDSIYQICVFNVILKSRKKNDYSGLAENLSFYNVLIADTDVARVCSYMVFQHKIDDILETVQVIYPKASESCH